jgi:tRNA (adenine57-N1/adenine58-N1)-methyltransferase
MSVIKENDLVVLRDSHGKEWLRQIVSGGSLHTHNGLIKFDDIIGQPYGSIMPILSDNLLIMKARPEQYTKNMKHGTNIIYEPDAVAMISSAGIGPGDTVLEVGTGSGGLTYFLAFYCTRNTTSGKVVTIDLRDDHSEIAQKNLKRINLADNVEFRVGILDEVLTEENFFDAAFVDMPTPWNLLESISKSILHGSSIMVFLPNWYQVEQTIDKALSLGNLTVINVFETNRRPLDVKPSKHIMRPVFRALVYSGVIIHLMKTIKSDIKPQQTPEQT